MLVSVTGNMVVALAWFEPALPDVIRAAGRAYGSPSPAPGMPLAAFLVAQIGVAYLLLLPAGALSLRHARR